MHPAERWLRWRSPGCCESRGHGTDGHETGRVDPGRGRAAGLATGSSAGVSADSGDGGRSADRLEAGLTVVNRAVRDLRPDCVRAIAMVGPAAGALQGGAAG